MTVQIDSHNTHINKASNEANSLLNDENRYATAASAQTFKIISCPHFKRIEFHIIVPCFLFCCFYDEREVCGSDTKASPERKLMSLSGRF